MVNRSQIRRLIIAGLRGSSGKTALSVGLAREWNRRGRKIAPFKKGPDYIDARWLSMAAGVDCHNLDVYLAGENNTLRSLIEFSHGADLALVEGNRGVFDGMDEKGSFSTAELAKLLKSPVVLLVDGSKTTRTAAAMAMGCRAFDPELEIAAIVLNNAANRRHGEMLRKCIESETGIPVVGMLPKLSDFPFPERHLGLVMPMEHEAAWEAVNAAADLVRDCVDIDTIWKLAGESAELDCDYTDRTFNKRKMAVRIGVIRDAAFSFYYPENLEQLRREGAEILEINSLTDECLPEIDALYIGGGFPETLAGKLSDNKIFRLAVKETAENGLPIYAECGGAMYLGESIRYQGATFPMVGALPITFELCRKPQGHGYTEIEVAQPNPFFEVGKKFRGHEFHYSRVSSWDTDAVELVMKNIRGNGFDGTYDGVCRHNILATYSHVFDIYGHAGWAHDVVMAADCFANRDKTGKSTQPIKIRVGEKSADLSEEIRHIEVKRQKIVGI